MSNVSDIYTLWLKPWHLPVGKSVSVTIQKVETRIIHPRPTEERAALILSFAGRNRKLILNDGNANKMSDIGGEDWTAWQGLVVQLKRVQFTKDKETIHVLPDTTPKGSPRQVATVEDKKSLVPQTETNAIDPPPSQPTQTNGGNSNGHTDAAPKGDAPTKKPYRFPNTAAEKFFKEVQQATGNHYEDGAALEKTLGGWFDFANTELWAERLSYACDMARQPA